MPEIGDFVSFVVRADIAVEWFFGVFVILILVNLLKYLRKK